MSDTATASSKHTAGPWEVEGVGVFEQSNRQRVTVVDEQTGEARTHRQGLIALVYERYGDYEGGSTHGGNARLVAAAPELLNALKEMRDALAAACRVIAGVSDEAIDRFSDELRASGIAEGFGVRADQAIAKAIYLEGAAGRLFPALDLLAKGDK